ncbi:hypothetical protein CCAX7_24800 [Capsulimonas corticalis]|uniref:Uncharacterized protein n=1 Tax=Capsulimonas corticalis TaxID=2219043 RepID=A0A9N7QA26_9BACT|nr:hypothetical protein [Capsulimonas corticalis]BDI30429.1 hypothetical protein CCAX7_24800 [Capsulimonas corticalis]
MAGGGAQVWRLSAAAPSIERLASIPANPGRVQLTVPAQSVTLLVLRPRGE